MKRAFVTGGSGFVGRALIQELHRRGVPVQALARSERAAAVVSSMGATPVRGDVADRDAMQAGMRGCDVVFHSAAYLEDPGDRAEAFAINVDGTRNTLAAARGAGVRRFVHVGTEAVLADGRPIRRADEERPRASRPAGLYPLTKGMAEAAVVAASGAGMDTVVIRPRFIWGKDDTSVLPLMIEMVKRGRWAWIDGGRYLTSTCHIDNVIEGAILAAEKGRGGQIYFLSDGEPVEFRSFLTALMRANGVEPGNRSVPRWLLSIVAGLTSWMRRPPVTRQALALASHEVTINDAKARRELGYTSHKSREAGLAEITDAPPPARAARA